MSIVFYVQADEAPELNCSNVTAFTVLELLQIEADYGGSIEIESLAQRVAAARATLAIRGDEFATRERVSCGERGAKFIQPAINADRFVFCLDRLEQIISFARANQIANLDWC